MRILPSCSLSLFQPLELFPLFPGVTAPWADQLPRKQYWGMHRPLPSLDALLADEEQPQTRTLLEQEAMQSLAEYLLEVSHSATHCWGQSVGHCLCCRYVQFLHSLALLGMPQSAGSSKSSMLWLANRQGCKRISCDNQESVIQRHDTVR